MACMVWHGYVTRTHSVESHEPILRAAVCLKMPQPVARMQPEGIILKNDPPPFPTAHTHIPIIPSTFDWQPINVVPAGG